MKNNRHLVCCFFILATCFQSVLAQEITLLPVKGTFDPAMIRNEDVSYIIYSIRDTMKMPIGESRNRVIINQAKDEVLRIQWVKRGKIELTDSSRSKLSTLIPMYLSSSHPNRNLILHFNNKKVAGYDLPLSGDTIIIKDSSKTAFFDAAFYDLLTRALPLKKGFTGNIPVYSYEEGCLGNYKITSVEEVPFTMKDNSTVPCFKVNLLHKKEIIQLWIAKSDRKLLSMQTKYSSNFLIETQIK